KLLINHFPPPIVVHDHASFLQCLLIGPEIPDTHRVPGREETMADGRISGRQPGEPEADRSAAIERQQPPNRPREPGTRLVPPHRLRKRKTAHQLREKSRQERGCLAARVLLDGNKILSLRCLSSR